MPLVQFVQRVEVHAHPLASILFLFTTINAHHHHFLERPLFQLLAWTRFSFCLFLDYGLLL